LSSYGIDGIAANESILALFQQYTDSTSFLSHVDWGYPGGLSMLQAWLGLAKLGLPRF
jgi:hypothetical protein